ncbi:MAG TPA: hypothetical protein VH682_20320 [Gemmataceae bacterium]|jgi:hypothetical protein
MKKSPPLDRRAFIGGLVLASLAPGWSHRSVTETTAEARRRLARTALDITDTFLCLLDADPEGVSPQLGVPCPRQPPLDPPF